MSEPTSRLLPRTRPIFWDNQAAESSDPKVLSAYLRKLVNDLQDMYTEIAIKHNLGPQYAAQDRQPTPGPGQMLVWKDTGGAGAWWVLFNDGDTVKKAELT